MRPRPIRVTGPYLHTTGPQKGRKFVTAYYADGRKTTKLYSRYLMEEKLGRELDPSETVDHVDEDKTNDSIDNLAVLPLKENIQKNFKETRPMKFIEFVCPVCQQTAVKRKANVDKNRRQGKSGPFCSKKCAGKSGSPGGT